MFNSIDQIFSSLIIWFIGIIISELIRKKFILSFRFVFTLYIWHTLFAIIYYLYIEKNGGDALQYYIVGQELKSFGIGTSFIYFITSILIDRYNLSLIGLFLLFNIFGFVGLLFFYISLMEVLINKSILVKRLVLLTIFLPSLSFWTVAVGKDSLVFLSICLSLWAILKIEDRYLVLIFSILLLALIRPHISGVLFMSFTLSLVFDKNIPSKIRFLISFFTIIISIFLIIFIFKFLGISKFNLEVIINYISERQQFNQTGGGAVDITQMSFFEQLFTYAFRPLPYEAHSLTALITSFDNLFLLILFFMFIYSFFINKGLNININMRCIYFYLIIMWILLALTTANMGIAVRQKWMFFPYFILYIFIYIDNLPIFRKDKYEKEKIN